jgi:hypothetical protein
MLTISKPLPASQARTYHAREFAAQKQNYWSRDQQGLIFLLNVRISLRYMECRRRPYVPSLGQGPQWSSSVLAFGRSVRQGKKVKQRVVAHLGRKDQLAPHLEALIGLLQDETQAPRWVPIQDVSAPRASTWGPILVARHLFHHLSLGTILDGERPLRRHGQLLSERIFPLLANRLTRPGSEHALAQ